MPGRKSNVSTASVGPEDAAETPPTAADKKASKGKEGLSVDVSSSAVLGESYY